MTWPKMLLRSSSKQGQHGLQQGIARSSRWLGLDCQQLVLFLPWKSTATATVICLADFLLHFRQSVIVAGVRDLSWKTLHLPLLPFYGKLIIEGPLWALSTAAAEYRVWRCNLDYCLRRKKSKEGTSLHTPASKCAATFLKKERLSTKEWDYFYWLH